MAATTHRQRVFVAVNASRAIRSEDFKDLDAYTKRFLETNQALEVEGAYNHLEILISMYLAGLASEYGEFVSTILAISLPLRLENVIARARRAEEKKKVEREVEEEAQMVEDMMAERSLSID